MYQETTGVVISVKKQWWLKINTKPFRMHSLDGATFPCIIKVKYTVDGKEYTKRKWLNAGIPAPQIGRAVTVIYPLNNPKKAKIYYDLGSVK